MNVFYKLVILAIAMHAGVAFSYDLYSPPSVEMKTAVDENGNEVIRIESLKLPNGDKKGAQCYKGPLDRFSDDIDDDATHVYQVGKPAAGYKGYSIGRPGMADAVSAFRILSPPGWNGKKAGRPDLNIMLRWKANENWVDALEFALKGTDIKARVEWDKRSILFTEMSYKDTGN